MRTSLLTLTLTLLATPALAEPTTLTFGGGERALRRASADAVTADPLAVSQLAVAHGLDLPLPYGATLAAEAAVSWGSATGTMLQTLNTSLDTVDLAVGARVAYRPLAHVTVSGHLDVGAAHAHLAIHDSMMRGAADGAWGGRTAASVALDLLAVDRPGFGLGFRIEAGYVETTAVGLVAHQDAASDGTLKLPLSEASLGHLDVSGPTFAISLLGRI
jgi:hypothetical protein